MVVDAGALIARALVDRGISPSFLPFTFYSFFLTLNRDVHIFTAKVAKTPLGIYRILRPRCRLRVSPLCLGTMNLGGNHNSLISTTAKEEATPTTKLAGTSIDTSNNYQDEQSEI
ncbi:hypothetical protein ARMSODRAFT_1016571 [Armillaria solidipes]|uniref:Uncharacterized protein n=1 Tax=Armillaria solidipes TaxID=1076256 RepID=A0A2H3BL23_9AGAR|nr:hypothetical protein ARMSODRAFT_1016571 [Armillaria solidipes]